MKALKLSPRDEARERLADYITSKQLNSGDRLPSERDLCTLWGINRITLRGAIQALIADGVLCNKAGSGTYVAPDKLEINLQELKSFSQAGLDAGRVVATRLISSRVVESDTQIAQHLNIKCGQRVLELTRLRLLEGDPAVIETTYLCLDRFPGINYYDFSVISLYTVIKDVYNVILTSGNEKIAITYATAMEAQWLEITTGSPVFLVSGVVSDANGTAVEFFKYIARNDRVRFLSRLISKG